MEMKAIQWYCYCDIPKTNTEILFENRNEAQYFHADYSVVHPKYLQWLQLNKICIESGFWIFKNSVNDCHGHVCFAFVINLHQNVNEYTDTHTAKNRLNFKIKIYWMRKKMIRNKRGESNSTPSRLNGCMKWRAKNSIHQEMLDYNFINAKTTTSNWSLQCALIPSFYVLKWKHLMKILPLHVWSYISMHLG